MNFITRKIPELWHRISVIGLEDEDHDEARRLVVCNQIAFVGILSMLAYNAFYAYYDPVLLIGPMAVNFTGVGICLLVLYCNHVRVPRMARFLMYVPVNMQIYLLTYFMGIQTGMHLLHIMMVSFCGVFFARETRLILGLLLLLPVVLFFTEYSAFTPELSPVRLNQTVTRFLYITLSMTVFILVIVFFGLFYKEIIRNERLLQLEHERSEGLLLNILPASIAARLKDGSKTIADSYPSATILFADLVGFTDMAAKLQPEELVQQLNILYREFDQLVEYYGVEKIKTLGDAYMIAGGIPVPRADHVEIMADLALDMQELISMQTIGGKQLDLRIGFHAGPVVAGVIGINKFSYDVWGDAVNIASRLESNGIPGRVHVSEACFRRLGDNYNLEERGEIDIKGVGRMRTYFLTGRR